MLKHALISAPEGLPSKFNDLETVDYGTNVPEAEFISYISGFDKTKGCPHCNTDQFMAWFNLLSIKSFGIWAQSLQEVVPPRQKLYIEHLHTLVLARSIIKEEIPRLLTDIKSHNTPFGPSISLGKGMPSDQWSFYTPRPPFCQQDN